MNEFINEGHPVYISYAGAACSSTSEDPVKILRNLLTDNKIDYRDYRDLNKTPFVPYKKITEGDEKVGNGDLIIVIFSDEYLFSLHCMYEWYCIVHHEKQYKERVIPLFYDNARERLINDIRYEALKKEYVNQYKKVAKDELKKRSKGESISDIEKKFLATKDAYASELSKIREYLDNDLIPRYDLLINSNFTDVLRELVERIKAICPPKQHNVQVYKPILKYHNNIRLVSFDSEVERLYLEFEKFEPQLFKVINLIGMGGSGKSSLARLFAEKYSDKFFNIAYVTVNGSLKVDIFDELNKYFNIPVPEQKGTGESIDVINDNFHQVLTELENLHCPPNLFNLLIIDINETANVKRVQNALGMMGSSKYSLQNWKILVVSREVVQQNVKTFEPFRHDYKNIDYLKKIFFNYLDDKKKHWYETLDFVSLFEQLYYLPLLAEQLASYLNRVSRKSLDNIFELLEVDRIYDTRLFGPLAIEKQYDTVKKYLSKLVSYSEIDDDIRIAGNLKNIVRHMILWPNEYYNSDQLYVLLHNMFTDKDDLEISLWHLNEKCIIDHRSGKDEIDEYKIHGLISKTFEEQIFERDENGQQPNFVDYADYINNVLQCRYFDEAMKKCVLSSICKHNIINDYAKIIKIAKLLGGDYKKILYDKALKIYYSARYKKRVDIADYQPKGVDIIDKCVKNMVEVPEGEFIMENHRVRLSSYYIGKYEVTQKEWTQIMHRNKSRFCINGENNPVESISWFDCIDFIITLNDLTGLTFCLPTEAQWVWAARGGDSSKDFQFSGSNNIDSVGYYSGNAYGHTHPVGEKSANKLGIHDMAGNVKEWCFDWYGDLNTSRDEVNPSGPERGKYRVVMGGSWYDAEELCMISHRSFSDPDYNRDSTLGFRLALNKLDLK